MHYAGEARSPSQDCQVKSKRNFLNINWDCDASLVAAKNAYCYSNILYDMPLFGIFMMIIHLEFYENWSGKSEKSGNFVVGNEWEPCLVWIYPYRA